MRALPFRAGQGDRRLRIRPGDIFGPFIESIRVILALRAFLAPGIRFQGEPFPEGLIVFGGVDGPSFAAYGDDRVRSADEDAARRTCFLGVGLITMRTLSNFL